MIDRRKKPAARADVLLHLAFLGLIGAATIILFSVAAGSFLDTDKEPRTTSRMVPSGMWFKFEVGVVSGC
jgi:uncharacterized membrane protein